jgi:four helix bundle protein
VAYLCVIERRFAELAAYRCAVAVADFVYPRVRRWASFERSTLGFQLVKAAESVGANIAEATGRWHRGEQRQFLMIARGSLYETAHWIRRAQRLGLVDDQVEPLLEEAGKTLNGLIKSLGTRD